MKKLLQIILPALLLVNSPSLVGRDGVGLSGLSGVGLPGLPWDTEINLDTIDQERLPKRVTGGLLAMGNISNLIIRQDKQVYSSSMDVGGELGGFVDFSITKHFAMQGRIMVTAEQNIFRDGTGSDHLWSFGIDIPVLFLARFGNLNSGYLSFGGGPYTHFNWATTTGKYKLAYHAGLGVTIFYEWPVGVQVAANYMVSLNDIVDFYKDPTVDHRTTGFYPQRFELGIGYRFK